MLTLVKRILATAVVIAAVAAPTAAFARAVMDEPGSPYPVVGHRPRPRPAPATQPRAPPRASSGAMRASEPEACSCSSASAQGPPSRSAAGRTARWPVDTRTRERAAGRGETRPLVGSGVVAARPDIRARTRPLGHTAPGDRQRPETMRHAGWVSRGV